MSQDARPWAATPQPGSSDHPHAGIAQAMPGQPSKAETAFFQLLTPSGERKRQPEIEEWVSDVDADALRSLYRDMVLIRRLDTEATSLQRQGQLGLWPPLLGQEAAQVGSTRGLEQNDFIFPSYRENGVAFLRGVPLDGMLKVWRGNAHGGWDPSSGVNMATNQVIIASQTLHATGYAMGATFDDDPLAVLTYFGDGASSKGDLNEAMVFAASFNAPVVFFCQNNHWAISEPVGLQAKAHIADRAPGFGIPSVRVDGNDVLAVLAVTRQAAARARAGAGPSFIEAVTYRMGPHTTADDPTRYRDANELEDWAAKDPIKRLAQYLQAEGVLTDEVQQQIDADPYKLAKDVRSSCINLPEPDAMEVFDDVYAEPHSWLDEQRQGYQEYLAGFADHEQEANA